MARTHECDFPPEALGAVAVTGALEDSNLPSRLVDRAVAASVHDEHTIYSLDGDRLASLRPDLVFTQWRCGACAVDSDTVEGCALPHGARVADSDPTTLEEVLGCIVAISESVGVATTGRSLVARLRSRLHWVTSIVGDLEPPRVAVIEWPAPVYSPGQWVPDMVEAAGGLNVFGARGMPSRRSDVEQLARARPDVVILAFCGLDLYQTQSRFKDLTADPAFVEATRFARTFAIDGSAYLSRPGPRLVDGVELLAWALHRPHPRLQPSVGRGAKLIEAGWVDLAALPVNVDAPV